MKYWIPCKLSAEGLKTIGNNGPTKVDGHIIGESHDKKCWIVSWKGKTFGKSYHKDFIELRDALPGEQR